MPVSHVPITNPWHSWSHHDCPLQEHRLDLEWPVALLRLLVTDRDPNRARAMGLTVLKCWPNARIEHHSWIWNPGEQAAVAHEVFGGRPPEHLSEAPRFEEQHAEVADVINLAGKIGYKTLKSDLWILDREFERAGAGLVGNTGLICDVADLIDDPMDLWKQYQRVVGKLPEGFDPESPIHQLSLLLRVIEAGVNHGFRLPVDPWTPTPQLFGRARC